MMKFLSGLYDLVTTARNALFNVGVFRSYRSSLPVISVGNLTAGGNGKTPLTLFIASKLKERGMKPVILSRGYGGSCIGPHILDALDTPELVGDEPILLSRQAQVPVVVSRSRAKGAKRIEKERLGDIIVLDDGFQHRWLYRNVDILCIDVSSEDAIDSFCKGEVLPKGRFREDRDVGLSRSHMAVLIHRVVIEKAPQADPRILRLIPDTVPVFRAYLSHASLSNERGGNMPSSGAEVSLVAAIANPFGFEKSVQALGYSIAHTWYLDDHHLFSQTDIDAIRTMSEYRPVICTTKDYIKLKGAAIENLFVLETSLSVTPEDAFIVGMLRHTLR